MVLSTQSIIFFRLEVLVLVFEQEQGERIEPIGTLRIFEKSIIFSIKRV